MMHRNDPKVKGICCARRTDGRWVVQIREEKAAMKTLAAQNKGLFTVQAMWEAMPLDMYCQVVGNTNRHPFIVELLNKGLLMGAKPFPPATPPETFLIENF